MSDELIEALRNRSSGHEDIWECGLGEFIDKVSPVLSVCIVKDKLSPKVVELSAGFLRLKFDNKELKGTIDYEVKQAVQEALIYFVNVAGEDID